MTAIYEVPFTNHQWNPHCREEAIDKCMQAFLKILYQQFKSNEGNFYPSALHKKEDALLFQERSPSSSTELNERIQRLSHKNSLPLQSPPTNIQQWKEKQEASKQSFNELRVRLMTPLIQEVDKQTQAHLQSLDELKETIEKKLCSLKIDGTEHQEIKQAQRLIEQLLGDLDHGMKQLKDIQVNQRKTIIDNQQKMEELAQGQNKELEQKILLTETIHQEIGKALNTLQDELIIVEGEQEKFKVRLDDLHTQMKQHTQQIQELSHQVHQLTEKNDRMGTATDQLNTTLVELKNTVIELEKKIMEQIKRREKRNLLIGTVCLVACVAISSFAYFALSSAGSGLGAGVAAGEIAGTGIELKFGISVVSGIGGLLSETSSSKKDEAPGRPAQESVSYNPTIPPIRSNSQQPQLIHPVYQLEREQKLDAIYNQRIMALTQDIMFYPINQAVQKTAQAAVFGVQWLCNSHPTARETCDATVEFSSDLARFIGSRAPIIAVKEQVNRLDNVYQQAVAQEITYNERTLGIPRHLTIQGNADAFQNLISLVPIGVGSRVLRGPGLNHVKPKPPLPIPALQAAPTSYVLRHLTSKSENRKIKWAERRKKHELALAREQDCIKELLLNQPSINKPLGFPKHLDQFFSRAKKWDFHQTGLTVVGEKSAIKGKIKGHVLYQPMDDSILFVLRQNRKNIHIESTRFSLKACWKDVLENAFNFAEGENCKKVFIAWNPNFYPVASLLKNELSKPILGISTFSAGKGEKLLYVIETSIYNIDTHALETQLYHSRFGK